VNKHAIPAVEALTHRFLLDYPREAAQTLERLAPEEAAPLLGRLPVHVLRATWDYLIPSLAERLLTALPDPVASALLRELDPGRAAATLIRLEPGTRQRLLAGLDRETAQDLERLIRYPADSAGALMETRVAVLRPETTVGQALEHLRQNRPRTLRSVFLVDEQLRLQAVVDLQDLALAPADSLLGALGRPVTVSVSAVDPRDLVVELLEQQHLEELPVLDLHGQLLGVIRAAELMRALQESTSADLQMMVGVSKDERALSPVGFAVRKRLLWMHINLLTAFLAAAVVGVFESTIAQFTALAVLLPVVAGQSGNAGAQAKAVTMRGLALHEIGIRQWLRMVLKEFRIGLINGAAVAVTTAAGVYVWSGSAGLALIISLAMVLSMTIACVAGALVPIMLTRFGQDPAQSSSIILTTVTDVSGFLSFLGIAALLSGLLLA
jgi:magnesium transporter